MNEVNIIHNTLEVLSSNQEFNELKKRIGKYSFVIVPDEKSLHSAASDLNSHKIFLSRSLFDLEKNGHFPKLIASIVFEFHNLAQENEFKELIGRVKELDLDSFVQEYEALEYRSARKTRDLVRKTFPRSTWSEIDYAGCCPNFQLHYLMQQATGHSQRIAERYRSSFPEGAKYHGTWSTPLSDRERSHVTSMIYLFAQAQDEDPEIASRAKEKLRELMESLKQSSEESLYSFPYLKLIGRIKEIQASADHKKDSSLKAYDNLLNTVANMSYRFCSNFLNVDRV